ncbi:MAG: FAD:protein FMN transferase [Lachnospiraceae bacterium]|nr:FAD:protein FMN transferase [Lachnospiraceae bacterium]
MTPHHKTIKKSLLAQAPALCLLLCTLTACASRPADTPMVTRNGFFFNTFIQISIYDSDDETILDGCMALADRYEKLFSATKEESDISRINAARGKAVTVDEETASLLKTAVSYSEKTDGRFDVTIGAVSSLWNFSEDPKGPVPDEARIAEALTHVGYRNIVIDENTVRLADPDTAIDCGAIAKGYIADRLKDYLLEQGVRSALINLGGNVLAVGEKPAGAGGTGSEPFRVGIQQPFDTQGKTAAVVPVSDRSTVSSGSYERFFEEDGRFYHHILDPETGYPADSGLAGVTILCESSADADALSTACFLMGAEEGLAFIEKTAGAEALFLVGEPYDTGGYEILTTSGFPEA